jgi:hypothetical protein
VPACKSMENVMCAVCRLMLLVCHSFLFCLRRGGVNSVRMCKCLQRAMTRLTPNKRRNSAHMICRIYAQQKRAVHAA